MAKGKHGHVGTHRSLPSHGTVVNKERHKGGPSYSGRSENHGSLGGMPHEHALDPPSRSLSMRHRTGQGASGTPRTAPDKRLGYTR
jgi:hypothetical protein